ncbi:alpha/beta hydrolase family protein [Rhodococcus sp. IEGM 1379]|uniref:alpha/beta hydrolase n=1 Tax=Rhodococcus sp. IEGM 1379 TaxID=3047086 RepID=UPI0024B7BF7D|nr:alpha/beta hydrolase family protein [Rhodococcus sp. IEGM 1379]MDI9917336.1 alpha/beta hydrolase family protein [Rhodococcus sp. IEGM 1379]
MRSALALSCLVAGVPILATPTIAAGESLPASSVSAQSAPEITSVVELSSGVLLLDVASPAMQRTVQVKVLSPSDTSVPQGTLYLLDGNSGRTDDSNWIDPTAGNVVPFFADKNAFVVLPIGGTGTMYTDWQEDHPKFGRLKWETFLTKELPPLIDAKFNTNGRNAIGGISMGAEAALMLAQRAPGLYDAVAGYSGCYTTVGGFGKALTDLVVINGMATSEQMWGPVDSPAWREHDIFANADKLRGTKVYLSSGTGLPGPHETLETPELARVVIVGGVMEFGSTLCTDQISQVLRDNGVDVTRSAQPVGIHGWPYWRDELVRSWPLLESALAG